MLLARTLTAAALACACVSPAMAQNAPSLTLELNALAASENGCRLTFVVTNGLSADLSQAGFEMALFNKAGVVDRLTALDFKDMPAGKTKVTRFNLQGLDCAQLGRVLINEVTSCSGQGVDVAACRSALKTQSKASGVEFGV